MYYIKYFYLVPLENHMYCYWLTDCYISRNIWNYFPLLTEHRSKFIDWYSGSSDFILLFLSSLWLFPYMKLPVPRMIIYLFSHVSYEVLLSVILCFHSASPWIPYLLYFSSSFFPQQFYPFPKTPPSPTIFLPLSSVKFSLTCVVLLLSQPSLTLSSLTVNWPYLFSSLF